MKSLRNLALGAVALAASVAAHAAAFQNGSFENGVFTASPDSLGTTQYLYAGDTAMTGWVSYGLQWGLPSNTSRVGEVAWIDCPGGCWTDLAPQDGNRFVDLTGRSDWQYGAIYQSFDTVAGQQYTVDFQLGYSSTWSGTNASPRNLYVVAKDGSSIVADNDPDWTLYSSTTPGWSAASYSFTAAGSTTTLFFAGGYDANHYVGLDNVSVTAVPEPETYAMMLAGLAAIGALARRRKAK
ncbi:MAG: FxDxF family PEP-CTERM protein [Burkholderiaceae bacterium]|nr:FxDxF family PEP-CTERM protein [Burkholderiaceae bacterium]